MKILAIETSCDETAVTVLEASGTLERSSFRILGDALYSQAKLHTEYGGVYPSLAKREHQKNLVPLATKALTDAGMFSKAQYPISEESIKQLRDESFQHDVRAFLESTEKPPIDLIAVTNGPGLEPALWTGVSFAQVLGAAWGIPVLGVDHMEGHIFSAFLKKEQEEYIITAPRFPVLSLLISGGHTELILMKHWCEYELIGRTRDDAVGEAFDKVARLLALPYPGGPEIDAQAALGCARETQNPVTLPRPMLHDDSCDFSFSGLKTAVLYLVRDMSHLSKDDVQNIAQEFEDAVRDVLVSKTKRAIERHAPQTLVVGGGVSANTYIREGLEELIRESHPDTALAYPAQGLTGDNAVMIGVSAYIRTLTGKADTTQPLVARGSQSLAEN